MRVLLAGDLAGDAAGILDVLVAIEDIGHRRRLRPYWIPQMDREDDEVPSRIVIEHRLGGRIGKDAAVPVEVEFAVGAHRRKGGRKSSRSHYMPDVEPAIAGVEIAHLADPHMRCADRQARTSPIDQVEVHQLGESLFERRRRVVAGAVGAKWKGIPGMGKRVRREKAGNALGQRAPLRPEPV
jgi:hypothetical protein